MVEIAIDVALRGGRFAAWTPGALAPSLWLAADQGTYQDAARTVPAVADGDPVGGWADKSAGAHHASQATAGARPTRQTVTNGSETFPVLRFDGVDDWLQNLTYSQAQPLTVGLVVKFATPTDAAYRTIFDGDSTLCFIGKGASNNRLISAPLEIPAGVATSSFEVWTGFLSGASSALSVNGVITGTGNPAGNGQTGYRMGYASNATAPGNIDLAELVVVPRALTATEQDQLEAYLAARAGVTLS